VILSSSSTQPLNLFHDYSTFLQQPPCWESPQPCPKTYLMTLPPFLFLFVDFLSSTSLNLFPQFLLLFFYTKFLLLFYFPKKLITILHSLTFSLGPPLSHIFCSNFCRYQNSKVVDKVTFLNKK
jgi:hypothetical protein